MLPSRGVGDRVALHDECLLGRSVDHSLHGSDSVRRHRRDSAGDGVAGVLEVGRWDQAVEPADGEQFVGGHVATGQQDVERSSATDRPRPMHRAAGAGENAEGDLGLADAAALRTEAEVEAAQQFASASAGDPVEQADRDEASGAQAGERRRGDVRLGRRHVWRGEVAQHVHVAVHEEEVRISASEHDHSDRFVRFQPTERVEEGDEERAVDEVRRGMVDRHRGDGAVDLDLQCHRPLLPLGSNAAPVRRR